MGMFYWFGIALGCGALRSILTAMGLVRFAAIVQLVAFCESLLFLIKAHTNQHWPLAAMTL